MPSAFSAPTLPFLERLLDGEKVEWKTLGEVCDRTKGTKITATQMKAMHKSNAPVKIFAGGQTFALVDYNDLPQSDIYFFPSIIVKSRGIIEFEYYDKPFSHKSEMWSYHTNSPDVNAKFLYYYLKTREDYFQQLGSVMQMPQISIPTTEKFPIPLPPLRVQARIVDILDKFTQLEAELEAELEARNKQYDFYRNRLLSGPLPHSPNMPHQWEQVPLGSIGEVRMCKRILKQDTTETGEIPFYKIGTFGKSADAFISRTLFEEYKQKYAYPRIGDILISASGTIGRAIEFDGQDAYFQDSNIVWLAHDDSKVLNRFLYYCYQIADWKVSKGGTISRLYNDNIKKTLIPLPPLSEQRRIVDILDRFDTLTNSISEGLPREITLRRKQYEYYRDALLRFPPPAPTA
jgi:putative type I restriction enzyme specificity protein HI_0216